MQKLEEGCWAFPMGLEGLEELKTVMASPVRAEDAAGLIYSLVGDDVLFDRIGDVEDENPDADVRTLICHRICEMIEEGGFVEDDEHRDDIYNYCKAIDKGMPMGESEDSFDEFIPEENLDRIVELAGIKRS